LREWEKAVAGVIPPHPVPCAMLVNGCRVVPIRGQLVQLLGMPWNRDEALIASSVRQLAGQFAPGAFPILLAHHPHAVQGRRASARHPEIVSLA